MFNNVVIIRYAFALAAFTAKDMGTKVGYGK